MAITNDKMSKYAFLARMVEDDYYPENLVEKAEAILVRLCEEIESENPQSLEALYRLTHAATEEFNLLAGEFEKHDSEIETVAREAICEEFCVIAEAYGFEPDIEEIVAPREW